jgi:quercetin dioxygenase-like cupin family protein
MGGKKVAEDKKIDGKVVKLIDSIEYQEGSVVSKTIINKKMGTVTLFAFNQGQGLSEHSAPYDALVSIFEGEAIITISGNAFQLKKGEMIIMPAKEPHSLEAVKKFKMLLIMIRD